MIKRYWKLIVLALTILCTFTIFYMQTSLALEQLPQFKLNLVSGDEKELEYISMQGYYWGEIDSSLTIDQTGSSYQSNFSYLDKLSTEHYPKAIQDLQKNHRSFMRGKLEGIGSFFEDDQRVLSAEIYHEFQADDTDGPFTIHIEQLDKENNKVTKVTSPVPTPEKFDYIFAENIQIVDDHLIKLVTRNTLSQDVNQEEAKESLNHEREEHHVYTFDLSKQTLIDDEIIDFEQSLSEEIDSNDATLEVFNIDTRHDINPKEFMVFDLSLIEYTQTEEGLSGDVIESQIFAYHFETSELKEIHIENHDGFSPILYKDPILYFDKLENDNYKVLLYDLTKDEVISKTEFPLEEPKTDQHLPAPHISDDRLYIINEPEDLFNEAELRIYDLNTAEELVHATIESEDPIDEDYELELWIDEINP